MAWVTQESAGAEYIRITEAGDTRITEDGNTRVTALNSSIWGNQTNSGTWTTATTTTATWVLAS